MRGAVPAGACHLPLRPQHIAVQDAPEHPGGDVGHEREDLLPVAPDLAAAGEPLGRVGRGLVTVADGETALQGIQVVPVNRPGQLLQQRLAGLRQVSHHRTPVFLIHCHVMVT
jgi:hypothetical protein